MHGRSTTIRRRGVPVLLIALLTALAVSVPAGAAQASWSRPTLILGFNRAPATLVEGGQVKDAVVVKTWNRYTARTVQVQRRPAGTRTAWQVESTGRTTGKGRYTAVLQPPASGVWEYRLHVPATSKARAATTKTRKVTATPAVPVVPTPNGLTATPGDGEVVLAWGPVGAYGTVYRVYRADGPDGPFGEITDRPIEETTWTASGLENGRTYWFKVAAQDAAGRLSALSDAVPGTPQPLPDTAPPGPVTGLTVTATTADSISLSWVNPADADLAEVIVRRAAGATPPASASTGSPVSLPSPTATSVTDPALTSGTQYAYSVFTRDTTGNISDASSVDARTAPAAELSAAVSLPLGSSAAVDVAGLTGISEISSASSPSGVTWHAESGVLRVSAAMSAATGSATARLVGVGCTADGCGTIALDVALDVLGVEAPSSAPVQDLPAPSADRAAAAAALPYGGARQLVDEVAVVLGTAAEPGTRTAADAVAAQVGAVVSGGVEEIGVFQFRWLAPQDITAAVARLQAMPGVAGIDAALLVDEPDAAAAPAVEPSDWDDDGLDAEWHLRQIRAPQAWAVSTGSDIPVGIVDEWQVSGHQDLGTIARTGGTRPDEHATHVAGLACAKQNGIGLVGAAWGCPLISDAVSHAYDGDTAGDQIALLSAVPAAKRVIQAGAKVVNLSLGFKWSTCVDQPGADWMRGFLAEKNGGTSSAFRRLAEGLGKDTVFTLAAGNNCGPDVHSPFGAAADLPNVITVSSVNQDGRLSSFSNWGAEVAAGGGAANPSVGNDKGVWSTLPGNKYGQDYGTSMAAPIVAGVAALVRSAHPAFSAADVGRCITGTAGTATGIAAERNDALPARDPDRGTPQIAYPGGIPIVDAEAAVNCGGDGGGGAVGSIARVSVATGGTQANSGSGYPSLSADGRYVAFASEASNLVPGDTNNQPDVFVHDRQTGTTTRVSVATDGTQGNDFSLGSAALSSDGRYVAFSSAASNLVPGDTNSLLDVFVHDRQTGTTTRVSVATDGTQANSGSGNSYVSADGRYVAFDSEASNLAPGDTNSLLDVFVHDRQTGTTTRISVANAYSQSPSLSADGRYVAFKSRYGWDVEGAVFVHDRQTGTTTLVAGAGPSASAPSLSADGRYVAFESNDVGLVGAVRNGVIEDVFVHDRQTGTTTRVSVATDGTLGDSGSGNPSLSADGRYVAFDSRASNLAPGDSNRWSPDVDVFVHDRQTGTTTLVSLGGDTPEGARDLSQGASQLSADGRYVAFHSEANLVPGDTNNARDVFVARLR